MGKIVRSQYLDQARLNIDIDSTVKGSYGNQEGSRKGYNEQKRGQKSFHPQMAWITTTKECLHSWFRPGDTNSGNGTSEFIKECHARLPEEVTSLYRCDSAYFADKTMSVIETQKDFYLIKVKLRMVCCFPSLNMITPVMQPIWKKHLSRFITSTKIVVSVKTGLLILTWQIYIL